MKIILVNILLVSTFMGFSVEKSHVDFSTKTQAVETVSNIPAALNRDTNGEVSFEETDFVLSGFNFEFPRIYNETKIENYKSSYLHKDKPNARSQASHILKV
ncbi:MAG: hypothetical protein GXO87_03725 [Chlorobi bacterium]|nr:hypothetical protein [Chlorobiota bacterium]